MSIKAPGFDFDALYAEDRAAQPWDGAPLHFCTGWHQTIDLLVAHDEWQARHASANGARRRSTMWHAAIAVPSRIPMRAHELSMLSAHLRCEPHGRTPCACVGDVLYRAQCDPCQWATIHDDESAAVAAWHDHALAGWRALPILDEQEIFDDYPAAWRFDGAPIITRRSGVSTRSVPGRSPFGGYDISETSL